jgi:guanylate kinase
VAKGKLIMVSGPSGAGKSTICRILAERLPAEFAVSATTRAAKPQDAIGKRYQFVTQAEFQELLAKKAFLEYAEVFGNWYGTLRAPVVEALEAGRLVLLEIDVQGANQVKRMMPEVLGVFILPPDVTALAARLQSRGRDDAATIQRRLAEAQREMEFAWASGVYDVMVMNADLTQAVNEIIAVVEQSLRTPKQ